MATDPDKPNFIVASNALGVVARLARQRAAAAAAAPPHPSGANAGIGAAELTVTIELNTLLRRNRTLRASHLIASNLVLLARAPGRRPRPAARTNAPRPLGVSELHDEIFVVCLTLRVFAAGRGVAIARDRAYEVLRQCGDDLVQQIEGYVGRKFAAELERGECDGPSDTSVGLSLLTVHDSDSEDLLDELESRLGELTRSNTAEEQPDWTDGDKFILEVTNMRHNEKALPQRCVFEADPRPAPRLLPSYTLALLPPLPPPPLPPTPHTTTTYVSPRKGRERLLAGLFMVHSEDNTGLEYAFRDRSPTVPSYIRQNKKFKFIKVGKVQKFVNMFEDKGDAREAGSPRSGASSPAR